MGEYGFRSGKNLTTRTWGMNEKKKVEATSKISASKGNNCQNRRDLKYLIAPL